jgi:hypothetical protein
MERERSRERGRERERERERERQEKEQEQVAVEEESIQLVPRSQPPNIRPYRYPHIQKSEIENIVKEMLEARIIRHSQSAYSSPMVILHKKDETRHICPNYRVINL